MPKKLNAFHLKLIAIIAMLLNHIGSGFNLSLTHPYLFLFTETFGKLTFPIMAFLLVEGFHHTRNRKKYVLRLAAFWLISVVPFWLYFHTKNDYSFSARELVNNVLFTLLMGLLMMICCEKTKNAFLHVLIVIFFTVITSFSDWANFGVLIIYGYYRIQNPKAKLIAPSLYVSLPFFGMILLGHLGAPPEIASSLPSLPLAATIFGLLLSIPVLAMYNGERGYSPKWVKWGYYIFYPAHLLLLYFIRLWLF